MKNIVSVDLEEWYHSRYVPPGTYGSRLAVQTGRLLDLFSKHGVRATFFVLGEVAAEHPRLVRMIAGKGHEIASHGFSHKSLRDASEDDFRREVMRSLDVIAPLSAAPVAGFRAPYFQPPRGYDHTAILASCGLRYDSSSRYGMTGRRGVLHEYPVSSLKLRGCRPLLFSGGALFYLVPAIVLGAVVRAYNARGVPVHIFIHPRDVDPLVPEVRIPWRYRLAYGGFSADMRPKFAYLFSKFSFTAIREWAGS